MKGPLLPRFSLRTLLLTTLGVAMLCSLLRPTGMTATGVHTILVLAFAIPGASYGYDLGRSSRWAAIGTSVAAILGTSIISAAVLIADWIRLS